MAISEGFITRIRKCLNKIEKSTIDFYVVCERVVPFVTSMKIQNDNKHTLTNFSPCIDGGRAKESDHLPMTMEVKLEIPPQKKQKIEIRNFNDKASQEAFKENTSSTTDFTDCFETLCPML